MSHANGAWRPVVGYEGVYEVSNFGSVRSVDRVTTCHDGVEYRYRGRLLSQWSSPKGYRFVHLGGVNRSVHGLVLEAFVGPRPDGLIALHRDDNPANNQVTNLRWGTYSENRRDAFRNRRTLAARRAARTASQGS